MSIIIIPSFIKNISIQEVPEKARILGQRFLDVVISELALDILLNVGIFYFEPVIYVVWFSVGYLFAGYMRQVIKKVNLIFNAHLNTKEKYLIYGVGGFLTALFMPNALTSFFFYCAAKKGKEFYSHCRNQNKASFKPIDNFQK